MSVSPLAPTSFPNMPLIAGVALATAASGARYKGRDDLLLIRLAPDSSVAGVFTKSDTAASPVRWSRALQKKARQQPSSRMLAMPTPPAGRRYRCPRYSNEPCRPP